MAGSWSIRKTESSEPLAGKDVTIWLCPWKGAFRSSRSRCSLSWSVADLTLPFCTWLIASEVCTVTYPRVSSVSVLMANQTTTAATIQISGLRRTRLRSMHLRPSRGLDPPCVYVKPCLTTLLNTVQQWRHRTRRGPPRPASLPPGGDGPRTELQRSADTRLTSLPTDGAVGRFPGMTVPTPRPVAVNRGGGGHVPPEAALGRKKEGGRVPTPVTSRAIRPVEILCSAQ